MAKPRNRRRNTQRSSPSSGSSISSHRSTPDSAVASKDNDHEQDTNDEIEVETVGNTSKSATKSRSKKGMAQFMEYLLEYYDKKDNDKLKWKCLYCNQKWLGKIHSTKSQDHILSQLSGYKKSSNVSTCPGKCPNDVIKRVNSFAEEQGTLKKSIAERKKILSNTYRTTKAPLLLDSKR